MSRSVFALSSLLTLSCSVALVACSDGGSGSVAEGNPLVSGLQVSEVALFQGLKATVMKASGPADSAVPIVAGRAGLLRVYLNPTGAWSPREVVVRVELTQAGAALPALEKKQLVTGVSTDSDLGSTVNFDVPGATVSTDLTFSVSVFEATAGEQAEGAEGARYPATGEAPFGAARSGVVKIVLLPVAYGADGSNRTPPMTDDFVAKFHDRMLALYPASEIEITLGDTFQWSREISPDGDGWDTLLNAITQRRFRDGASPDVYYYGIFTPAASFNAYCEQGCVLGLSSLAQSVSDDWARASIGIGYPGAYVGSDETFAHEVGHAHGREHAPCDTWDYDRDFPYSDAEIGVWGYDTSKKTLVDPAGEARDMMGYCSPIWVSDYTYNALFDRIKALNTEQPFRLEVPTRWQSFVVNKKGVTRGEVITAGHAPRGKDKQIERIVNGRTERVTARFYPFDHLPGGLLYLPESEDIGTIQVDGIRAK